MKPLIITGDTARKAICRYVMEAPEGSVVKIGGKPRSLDQNAISHKWYEQVSNELKECSELDVKCFCKLHYGVPILRAEDDDFREAYDTAIKPLPYEKKLIAMRVLPVTSIMSVKQLSQYLEIVQDAYAGRVRLEFPVDDGGLQ